MPAETAKPSPLERKRKGRPLGKDAGSALEAIKPWVEEGMSRATWFRRQKAKQE